MTAVTSPGSVLAVEKISCYGMSFQYGVEAATQVYPGQAVAIMPDGWIAPSDTAGALYTIGRCAQNVLGTTAGAVLARVDQGIFLWQAGTNAPTVVNRGQLCYWQDNQTVTMTPGTLVAGTVEDVTTQGVFVLTALGANGSEGNSSDAIILNVFLADLLSSDAKVYYVVAPFSGTLTKLETILNSALTTGNATATGTINGTAITNGVVTMVQAGSAPGQENIATPTALNTVNVGDKIAFTIGGTQATATASANLAIYLTPN